MLKELIHNKVNEVFLEYQRVHFITSGDIDPFDAEYLDRLEEQLAQHIERVCAKQPKETTPSFYIYTDSEGIAHSVTYEKIDTDKFFCEISKRIAFDDLTNEDVIDIYWRGMWFNDAEVEFEIEEIGEEKYNCITVYECRREVF